MWYFLISPSRDNCAYLSSLANSFCKNPKIFRFDAIYPAPDEDFEKYSQGFSRRYGRVPVIGEYGCLLSHIKIWERFMASGTKSAIVLEDDAQICNKLPMPKIIDYVSNRDVPTILRIGVSKVKAADLKFFQNNKPSYTLKYYEDFRIAKDFFLNTEGTVGYIINRKAASLACNSGHVESGVLVDDWKFYESKGIQILTVNPYAIIENRAHLSTIDQTVRDQFISDMPLSKKMLLLPFKILDRVSRIYPYIKYKLFD